MKKIMIILRLIAKIERLALHLDEPSGCKSKRVDDDARIMLKMEQWVRDKKWREDKTMQQIAGELGLSREELSYFFRIHVGKHFLQWRKELRIEDAKKMLLDDKSIPTLLIAESVGINDKSNFRRQFKEVTGYTPAQWRLKN